jgi:hypothetical protein
LCRPPSTHGGHVQTKGQRQWEWDQYLATKATCPHEVEACETILEALGHSWDSFALAVEHEEFLDVPEGVDPGQIDNAWEKLQAAFRKATTVGKSHLELGIGHYSSDDGDRYDDLEQGCYFTVDNVTQFTPAGKKFQAHLAEKSWTVFG